MLRGRLTGLYQTLSHFVAARLSTPCALCGDLSEPGMMLCQSCRLELPWNRIACERCAQPLPTAGVRLCARCLRRPPPFDGVWAPLLYREPVDSLIAALKFNRQLAHAKLLGSVLSHHPPCATVDRIVPVPLHRRRLRERGYNQAVELARALARQLDIPLDWRAAQRTRHTSAQSGLNARERTRNVRDAFTATRRLDGERIALFDDVVTTGQTAAELARTLRRAGAREIHVWACARAPRPSR